MPGRTGRALCLGALTTCGAISLAHSGVAGMAVAVTVLIGLIVARRWAFGLLFLIAFAAGAAAHLGAPAEVPSHLAGAAELNLFVLSDPGAASGGWAFVAGPVNEEIGRFKLGIEVESRPDVAVGDTVAVIGSLSVRQGRLHRIDLSGWLAARSVRMIAPAGSVIGAANSVRSRVRHVFPAGEPPAALMRGFLIGDTTDVDELRLEEMRRSGLLHFVAVSGGNVAVFLGGIWLLLGVFPMGPRTRAAVGLAGIVLFVLVTRWEPSVVRAGTMLGLLLTGRLLGVPVDGWSSLGGAVTLLLLAAPQLLFDVGFQLSALATTGLLAGSGAWANRRPAFLWRPLAATLSAQLAVTPLLIATFGSVPAFSPVANVAAAPLVSLATGSGWAAVLTGSSTIAVVASAAADGVARIAGWAAGLPQVGVFGLFVIAGFLTAFRRRPVIVLAAVACAVAVLTFPPSPPRVVEAVFLDVGQGDAVLLRSPTGQVIAIDTGPDPVVYAAALRRHGVARIDLLVLTHGDRDHVGGLAALVDRVPVKEAWYPAFTPADPWADLLAPLGAEVSATSAGATAESGGFRLTVVAPGRRFDSDNDGSVVLWVEAGGTKILLAGDAEAVAQAELPDIRPDVLLVPHHGSATTDPQWLMRTAGRLAVLSYGADNTFGHPADVIIETLTKVGAQIERTAEGDVVIRP